MKVIKLFLCFCLSFLAFTKLEAVQVIRRTQTHSVEYERSPSETAGYAVGCAIGSLLRKSYEEHKLIEETRNSIYIENMLEEYTPDRHYEYVDCIERSALPKATKMLVIHEFEKIKRASTQ